MLFASVLTHTSTIRLSEVGPDALIISQNITVPLHHISKPIEAAIRRFATLKLLYFYWVRKRSVVSAWQCQLKSSYRLELACIGPRQHYHKDRGITNGLASIYSGLLRHFFNITRHIKVVIRAGTVAVDTQSRRCFFGALYYDIFRRDMANMFKPTDPAGP
jgi:hypothetical protein